MPGETSPRHSGFASQPKGQGLPKSAFQPCWSYPPHSGSAMSQCENEEQSFDVEQKVLASLSLSACLLAHVVLRLLGVTGLTALLVSLMVGAVAGATGALLICSLCRPPMDALELHTWFCDHVPTINRWLVRRDRLSPEFPLPGTNGDCFRIQTPHRAMLSLAQRHWATHPLIGSWSCLAHRRLEKTGFPRTSPT